MLQVSAPRTALAFALALGYCACAVTPNGVRAPEESATSSADDVAAELSNPTNALGSMSSNLDFQEYQGTLPGAGAQSGLTYTFQPSLPFPQGDGFNVLFRPAIPILIDRPVFDSGSGSFDDESWELGDIGFDLAYGTTTESGLILLTGLVGTLPTATRDSVGGRQWRFGPEAMVGVTKKWGVLGALVSHQWDVAGEDSYDGNITGGQYFYAFPIGKGWQVASGPTWSYNHDVHSDEALTLPLGVGVSKTAILGGSPWKFALQYWDYVESPDSFGLDWQVRITVTPVIKLPWGN